MSMIEAIAAHRAAWQAFQDAPDDEAEQAEDEEGYALDALLTLLPKDLADVMQLKAHLDWYVVEEGHRLDHTPGPGEVTNAPFALHAALAIALERGGDAG